MQFATADKHAYDTAAVDDAAAGTLTIPLGRTYRLEDVAQAHRDMEASAVGGKAVVVL